MTTDAPRRHERETRLAIAGLGYIGRAHAEAVRRDPDARLAAVVDPSDAAAAYARELGVPWHATLDEMLSGERPDGVVVATPNTLHVEHALACLAAGWPMLLEKPVAPTVREAAAIVRAAREANARVLVGHHRAHSPIIEAARNVVESGTLGALVCVAGSATFYKPDTYFADGPWRREPGAGPILLNLIHDVHNLRLLCGEIVAVQALASNATRGFPVEDTVAITLAFASGAIGTFLLSDTAASARSWEQTTGENPAYARRHDEDCYVLSGTRGSLAVPTMRLTRYARDEDRSWWKAFVEDTAPYAEGDPIRRQIAHFVRVIRGEVEPLVSLADGLANLAVTEAIAEAASTGTTVRIPPPRG